MNLINKKILLFLLLAFNSFFSHAAWTNIGSNEKTEVLADSETMTINGTKAQVNHMLNFKVTAKDPDTNSEVRSILGRSEFNCSNNQYRTISIALYTENMGSGTRIKIEETPNSQWQDVKSGSWTAGVFNTTCNIFIKNASISKSTNLSDQSAKDSDLKTSSDTINMAKTKCLDLGFKDKTEAFGKCVLRLSK